MDTGKLNQKIGDIAEKATSSQAPPAGVYKGPPTDPWVYIVTEKGDVVVYKEGESDLKTPNSQQREAILAAITGPEPTIKLAAPYGEEASPEPGPEEPPAEETPLDEPEEGTLEGAQSMLEAKPTEDSATEPASMHNLNTMVKDPEPASMHNLNTMVKDPEPASMSDLGSKIDDIAGRAWDKHHPSEEPSDAESKDKPEGEDEEDEEDKEE